MIELKPCPFCGGKATMNVINDGIADLVYVACESCFAVRKPAKTENEAAGLWNERAPGWISINDRLPEESANHYSADVLATNSFDVFVAWYDHKAKKWGSEKNEIDFLPVTHWMPLPETPECTEKHFTSLLNGLFV